MKITVELDERDVRNLGDGLGHTLREITRLVLEKADRDKVTLKSVI